MTSLLTIITVIPFEGPCSSSPPRGDPDLRSDEVRPCYPVCSLLLPRSLHSIGCTACAATQNKIYTDSSISHRSPGEITKVWLLQRALSLQAHPMLGSKHMPGSSSHLLIHRDEFVPVMLFPSCYIWSRGTGLGKTSNKSPAALPTTSLQAALPRQTDSSSLHPSFLILQRKKSCHIPNAFVISCYKKGSWPSSPKDFLVVFIQHFRNTHHNAIAFCS